MLQIGQRCAGRSLQLANFTLQLAGPSLRGHTVAAFQFAELQVQVGQLLHGMLDFFGELLPARWQPGYPADLSRDFHLANRLSFPFQRRRIFLLLIGTESTRSINCLLPLVQRDDLGELGANLGLLLGNRRTAFFYIPQIHEVVQLFFALLQQLGNLDHRAIGPTLNG